MAVALACQWLLLALLALHALDGTHAQPTLPAGLCPARTLATVPFARPDSLAVCLSGPPASPAPCEASLAFQSPTTAVWRRNGNSQCLGAKDASPASGISASRLIKLVCGGSTDPDALCIVSLRYVLPDCTGPFESVSFSTFECVGCANTSLNKLTPSADARGVPRVPPAPSAEILRKLAIPGVCDIDRTIIHVLTAAQANALPSDAPPDLPSSVDATPRSPQLGSTQGVPKVPVSNTSTPSPDKDGDSSSAARTVFDSLSKPNLIFICVVGAITLIFIVLMVLSCIYGPRFHYSKRTCRPGGCFPFVRRRNSVSAEHGKARTAVLPTSTQDVAVQGNASASASASASGTALDESPGAVPAAKLQPKGKRPSLAANHPYGPHAINKARLKELEQLPKLGPFIDLPERPTLPQTAARRRGSRVGGNGNVGGGGGGGGSNNGSSSAVSLAYSSSESLGATGDSNRAALAYTAARKEELSFRAGDMITFNAVTWRDGWIYATNERNGKVGYLSLRVFETHVMGRSTPAGGMLTNVANVDINVMAPVDMNDQ